ncbi:DNA repair protein RecO [uncultured Limosilactobacillus sp.]|uniref:DNA repair protein RecO n=1 Tax=uncultured Limosilactobacillus sp. TaxID=2837629 RepID=UPI0025D354C6|nr:DNA repair protein RecO [uncultured Limosilactobacillus sp.]
MAKQVSRFTGLVMSRRDFRERDLLVKMLTASQGPLMFLVRGAKRPKAKLAATVLPFSHGSYLGVLHQRRLSLLTAANQVQQYQHITADLTANAYATYLFDLVDAAFYDGQPLGRWFNQVSSALSLMDQGMDPQIIVNVLELQLLSQFGVQPTWDRCVVCGRRDLPLNYSEENGGMLCANHFDRDPYRIRLDQRTTGYLQLLSTVDLTKVKAINVSDYIKQRLQKLIDTIYNNQVGLHLRSRTFIRQMDNWDSQLKLSGRKD